MAAAAAAEAPSGLSKAEYLRRRYLEAGGEEEEEAEAEAGEKRRRRRGKKPKPREAEARGGAKKTPASRMRIVDDDDTGWKNTPIEQEKDDNEEEDGDLPVVAEFIDERPEVVKLMEAFRTSNKWKLLGDKNEELLSSDFSAVTKATNSPEGAKQNHPSKRRGRCDSSDQSPPRMRHGDLLDLSPKRHHSISSKNNARSLSRGQEEHFSTEHSASRKWQKAGDSFSPQKKTYGSDADVLLSEKQLPLRNTPSKKAHHLKKRQRHDSESSSGSPLWKKSARASSDSDLSPPRLQNPSSALSPPRRNQSRSSDSDLSPPRRGQEPIKSRSPLASSSLSHRTLDAKGRGDSQQGSLMLSGGQAGLVSAKSLRKEQEELRRQGRSSHKHLEAESRHAETVFRDKAGRKRDLKQERLEQQMKAEEKVERDEQYAKWGKGLAQSRQQQQNVEDAMKEMQKPLARYIDDQDLDMMLREQEREGDPMADFIRKKKAKEKTGTKEKPRYNGPAPPLNRFNIWPGHRWDGVDRSNGFEQKRFARIASKKAVQELAYKWSVEDM